MGWAFDTADALYCISYRTRDDLVRSRPRVAGKAVVARYGSDHVDAWPAPERDLSSGYALAFGHFANKNVDAVLDAWREFCRTDGRMVLRLIGMSASDRGDAERRVRELDIADRVELMPWLDDEQFQQCFVGRLWWCSHPILKVSDFRPSRPFACASRWWCPATKPWPK